MGRGKVCISLFADTAAELAAKIAEAQRSAEIVEVRYDSLRPDEVESGIEAAAASGADILATFRPAEQGGRRSLSPADREAFWRSLLRTGSWGVDAEPDVAKAAFAVNSEFKIASWHGPAPGSSEARALMLILLGPVPMPLRSRSLSSKPLTLCLYGTSSQKRRKPVCGSSRSGWVRQGNGRGYSVRHLGRRSRMRRFEISSVPLRARSHPET